jgi:hypothetical protein
MPEQDTYARAVPCAGSRIEKYQGRRSRDTIYTGNLHRESIITSYEKIPRGERHTARIPA